MKWIIEATDRDDLVDGRFVILQELVQCENCRWYEISKLKQDGTDDKRFKPDLCVLHNRNFPADYYCADGEKGANDEPTAED